MRLSAAFFLLTIMLPTLTLPAAERQNGRSMVVHTGGIAATSQTLASSAAAQILARGGSAIDAAIAANAVLGLVEPMMNGIGGDLFFLYRDAATGKIQGLAAAGKAPAGLSVALLKSKGLKAIPETGIHTVTVPGAVGGWHAAHQRYGKLPWAELFAPAIAYARDGFPLSEMIAEDWGSAGARKMLSSDANAKAVFLPQGQAPKTGEIFRNPGLARAYEAIAKDGPAAFYSGPIAEAILKSSQRLGGTLSAEDLASFAPTWQEPISSTYRGWRVYEMPPPTQGIGVLNMLNLMEPLPFPTMKPYEPQTLHLKMEAMKVMAADLRQHVADPLWVKVPTAGLASKDYARRRAELLSQTTATCQIAPGDPLPFTKDTIYLSVIDRQGNQVSWIQSISGQWGSGVAVDDYGFHLHNRGQYFRWEDGHPNQLAGGKRPFHTIIPAMMENAQSAIAFGIMGGLNQTQAHAQFVSYIADHGYNIQQAMDAPRFTKRNEGGCDLQIEDRIPAPAREELSKRGHILNVRPAYSMSMGGGQATQLQFSNRVKFAASDPRKDGSAIPQP
jgi:gamma-glutamyltranspeptidase / glutathione hydrolase